MQRSCLKCQTSMRNYKAIMKECYALIKLGRIMPIIPMDLKSVQRIFLKKWMIDFKILISQDLGEMVVAMLLGYYVIGNGSKANYPLRIDCALEAKCYSPKNSVGVREMSRLISRIRYRQFGVMLTTSYVHKQAYEEVLQDGHPILIVSASDIAQVA